MSATTRQGSQSRRLFIVRSTASQASCVEGTYTPRLLLLSRITEYSAPMRGGHVLQRRQARPVRLSHGRPRYGPYESDPERRLASGWRALPAPENGSQPSLYLRGSFMDSPRTVTRSAIRSVEAGKGDRVMIVLNGFGRLRDAVLIASSSCRQSGPVQAPRMSGPQPARQQALVDRQRCGSRIRIAIRHRHVMGHAEVGRP